MIHFPCVFETDVGVSLPESVAACFAAAAREVPSDGSSTVESCVVTVVLWLTVEGLQASEFYKAPGGPTLFWLPLLSYRALISECWLQVWTDTPDASEGMGCLQVGKQWLWKVRSFSGPCTASHSLGKGWPWHPQFPYSHHKEVPDLRPEVSVSGLCRSRKLILQNTLSSSSPSCPLSAPLPASFLDPDTTPRFPHWKGRMLCNAVHTRWVRNSCPGVTFM